MSTRLSFLVAALALAATACSGPSLDDLTRAADAVVVPAGWVLVDEETADRPCQDSMETCPRVDRTYRVPGSADFGAEITIAFEATGYEVDAPPLRGCGPNPEPGCSVGAHQDDVSLWAVVAEVLPDSYTVTIRASEYGGP